MLHRKVVGLNKKKRLFRLNTEGSKGFTFLKGKYHIYAFEGQVSPH